MSRAKSKGRLGTTEYLLLYTVTMMAVVTILFLFFPPLKDIMHMWLPTDWVRYTAIFLIIVLIPIVAVFGLLSRGGAMGMFILFDFPTKKYNKKAIAKFYFFFGIAVLAILLLAIFFIFGGQIV